MSFRNPKKRFGRYVNPHIKNIRRSVFDLILWRLGFYNEKLKRTPPPADFHYPVDLPSFDRTQPSVVWINHSTFLIQVGGFSFLTDPVFSSYCSPLPFSVLKRRHEPAITLDQLPPIDFVLISHNHYDHLDNESIMKLQCRFPNITWIVPRGLKKWFTRRKLKNVVELDWGESYQPVQNCSITAVPSQHFSNRRLFDKNRTLWAGFVVECTRKTFYFVGDTGYNPFDFKEIGKIWPKIDLSLIPIGTYVPQEFMKPVHISPYDAVEIHCDVKSRLSLGMHWKTFCLSEEPADLPPYDLYRAMKQRNLNLQTFLPIEPGIFVNW